MILEMQDISSELLYSNYSEDAELLSKYHIEAGKGLDSCVNRTFNDLSNSQEFSFFVVKENDEIVGFFGREYNNYLNNFFIRPKYRNKEQILEFWKMLKDQFTLPMLTGLYEHNTRAIDFCLKNGGVIVNKIDNVFVIRIDGDK